MRALVFLIVVSLTGLAAGAQPKSEKPAAHTPKTILERLNESRTLIRNCRIESIWKSINRVPPVAGVPVLPTTGFRWEKQTYIVDDLGRMRMITEYGPVGKDGSLQKDKDAHTTDTLFNGELVSYYEHFPHRTRVGEKEGDPEQLTGYHSVTIGDEKSPLISSVGSHRNALDYARASAVNFIEHAIKDNSETTVEESGAGVLVLKIVQAAKGQEPASRVEVAIVPSQGWRVDSIRTWLKEKGRMTRELTCKYIKQDDGFWLPKSGHDLVWGTGEGMDKEPVMDWSFEVTSVTCNDPKFDESLFEIRLPPDAAVSDTRFGVTYRIGEVEALTEHLAGYAQKAVVDAKELNETRFSTAGGRATPEGMGRSRTILLAVNVVIGIAIIALCVIRYRKKGRLNDA